MTVATLGDLVLDVSTRPLEPIASDTDTPSANRLEAGGQAANVAPGRLPAARRRGC